MWAGERAEVTLTVEGLGLQVRWHRSLDEVATDLPTVYIAHEFFDALPVHQFQMTGALARAQGKQVSHGTLKHEQLVMRSPPAWCQHVYSCLRLRLLFP